MPIFMRFIIEDWREKIKSGRQLALKYEKDLALSLIVILGCSLSYGLGRLAKIEESMPPLTITSSSSIKLLAAATMPTISDNKIVASKKGTKYHFPWCSGAKSIKAENRITFDSEAEAQAAGYTLAANCAKTP